MNWPGRKSAQVAASAPTTKTLRPCRKESKDFDCTSNLFIEGDNLEALKLLQEGYLGKVKMIYIDPPYNTGRDFIYKDNFTETTAEFLKQSNQRDQEGNRLVANTDASGRFHSDWLTMMYSRLKLARNLLADDGVMFISIDDNEMANLKKLCDMVFGEESALTVTVWQKGNAQNDAQGIQKNHEYVLAYLKRPTHPRDDTHLKTTISKRHRVYKEGYKDKGKKKYRYYILNGGLSIGSAGALTDRLSMGATIYYNGKDFTARDDYDPEKAKTSNDEKVVYHDDQELIAKGYTPIRPPKKGKRLGRWTWNKEKFDSDKHLVHIDPLTHSIKKKEYIPDHDGSEYHVTKKPAPPKSTLGLISDVIDNVSSGSGSKTMNSLWDGDKVFDNPKPPKLIEHFLKILTREDDLVLDFFAGSSTTAHAVMQLNAEDGGNRKFIMVQLPEPCNKNSRGVSGKYKTIADLSKDRIRRAGKEILKGTCHKGWEEDVGFRVLKIDSSNLRDVYYTPDEISQGLLGDLIENIKKGRTPDDLLFQVLVDLGIDLASPIRIATVRKKKVFFVGKDSCKLIACFDKDITEDFAKKLAKLASEGMEGRIRVVFRNNAFKSDAVKINVEHIFQRLSPSIDVRSI